MPGPFLGLIALVLLSCPPLSNAREHLPVVKREAAVVDSDGVQRIEVLAGEHFFEPNVIVLKINVPVELTVVKSGGFATHNMVVQAPDAGVSFRVEMTKKPQVVRFTPTSIGRYPFWCDKRFFWTKPHRERGGEGFIEVIE